MKRKMEKWKSGTGNETVEKWKKWKSHAATGKVEKWESGKVETRNGKVEVETWNNLFFHFSAFPFPGWHLSANRNIPD